MGGLEGVEPEKVSHEEVQKAAAEAQPKMTAIMKGHINDFKASSLFKDCQRLIQK